MYMYCGNFCPTQVGNSQPDIRGWCLGTDRHDRVYWRLHGFSGIMVESPSDEVWRIIDSRELLEQVIVSFMMVVERSRGIS